MRRLLPGQDVTPLRGLAESCIASAPKITSIARPSASSPISGKTNAWRMTGFPARVPASTQNFAIRWRRAPMKKLPPRFRWPARGRRGRREDIVGAGAVG